MNSSVMIARHEIQSLFREKTFLLLLVVFTFMTIASAFIGWSSQNTINQVYNVAAEQIRQSGQIPPPSPFASYPHLNLVKNMIIYINLIGGLLAIIAGYAGNSNGYYRDFKCSIFSGFSKSKHAGCNKFV
jgi:ABC-type transport system involved in multi-copper enzyme maturation permease subunit